ncbi:ribosome-associated protein [Kineococcus xinjiangensis]|uniref:Ribosome-associated protein n=1 Tax=Kineococcus xinjiangensis TaxID=512762 RepID=A0A2S6ISU5_9ACTN|nr:RNA-binding S4 domain-containing protein [Kineococcus xinjiangensis]PPK97319.1 ribosome-associated protein [Kineococcus xinjiangensis]
MRDIEISARPGEDPASAVIRLGQLLKLGDVAETGADARALLTSGEVRVNGEVEERRGRQLKRGDVVEVAGERLRLV